MSTETLIRETPSKNKGIERPSPVIRLAVKRRNNSEFILDSNGLDLHFQNAVLTIPVQEPVTAML